jgi:hypothetical protein
MLLLLRNEKDFTVECVCVCVRRSDFLTPQAATRFLKKTAMTARRNVGIHTHIHT